MKCYNCGHEQTSGRFCDNCGLQVTRLIVADDAPTAGPASPSAALELRCTCGHVQASGRFCDACGMMFSAFRAAADPDETTARCRQCGSVSATPVCRNCGIRIPDFPGEEE